MFWGNGGSSITNGVTYQVWRLCFYLKNKDILYEWERVFQAEEMMGQGIRSELLAREENSLEDTQHINLCVGKMLKAFFYLLMGREGY